MKLRGLLCAALAALSITGNAAVAVTQRQLTNACEQAVATADAHTAASMTQMSNYVGSVSAAGLSNYVYQAVETMTETVSNNNELIVVATNWLREVDAALVAESNFVASTSAAGLSNYVASAVDKINASLLATAQYDDGLYMGDDGKFYIYVPRVVDGLVTNVVQKYNGVYVENFGGYDGLRVKSVAGDNPMFAVGDRFALTGNSLYQGKYWGAAYYQTNVVYVPLPQSAGLTNTNSEFVLDFSYTNRANDVAGAYWEYSIDGEIYADDDEQGDWLVRFSSKQDTYDARTITLTQTLEHWGTTNQTIQEYVLISNVVQAVYKVEPYKLFKANWDAFIWGEDSPTRICAPLCSNEWCQAESEYKFVLTAINPVQPVLLMSAMLPRMATANNNNGGGDTATLSIQTYPNAPINCVPIDAYEYTGLDPDEYWVSPETLIRESDWNNLENWVIVPQSISLPVYDENGNISDYVNRKCKTIADIKKYMANYGDTHLPPKWGGYTSGKLKSCNDVGHIWEKCVCTVCKVKRDHSFDFLNVGQCKRCTNRNTKTKEDKRCKGGLAPDGDGDYCLEKTTAYNTGDHDGWYHIGEEYGEVACCCECGLYSAAYAQPHLVDSAEVPATWTDTGDGVHHYGLIYCQRETQTLCNSPVKKYENHELEEITSAAHPPQYVDTSEHKVWGKCSKTGCTYEGWITEAHDRDANCWCATCEHYCHESGGTKTCGRNSRTTCSHCGKIWSGSAWGDIFNHDFSPAVYSSTEEHHCACGEVYHDHIFENGKCVGGKDSSGNVAEGDSGCGTEKKWKGHKCPYRRKPDRKGGGSSTDEDHGDNDRSQTGFGGDHNNPSKCTDCGGGFGVDHPNIPQSDYDTEETDPDTGEKKIKARWVASVFVNHGGETSRQIWSGSATTLNGALTYVDNCFTSFKSMLSEGYSFECTFWFNPTSTQIETRAGTETVTNWDKDTYSGTATYDSESNLYIKWN